MNVKNLTIDGDSDRARTTARAFNGVAFMAASGSIKGVTLTNIGGTSGPAVNNGRAILVEHRSRSSAPAVSHDRGQHRLGLQQERDRRARQRRREDHQEHRHGLRRATSSPGTASSSTGPTTVAQVDGQHGQRERLHSEARRRGGHRDPRHGMPPSPSTRRTSCPATRSTSINDAVAPISGKKYSA